MPRKKENSSKTPLHFWVMPNAGFATSGILQRYISEFETTHPDVSVHLTIHPWSLAWTRIMDVIKGRYLGPLPDVIQVGTSHVGTLVYLNALEKVPDENVMPQDDNMSTYIWDPGVEPESGHDLFCVPWFIDVRVLYYRKDLFRQLNLTPEMLRDWKGFLDVCIALQDAIRAKTLPEKIIAPLGIPGQKQAVLMHDLAPWMWAAGGDFCSADLSQSMLDAPSSVKGCEFYFELIQRGFMPLSVGPLPQGNFFTGHYAMQFSGSWPVSTYLNSEWPYSTREVVDQFGVALYPQGPNGRFTFLGGSNLAVTSVSRKKELSWEFVRFMIDSGTQLEHAKSIGALTARQVSMPELFKGHIEAKQVFWESLNHARRLPRLVELGSVEQIIYKMGLHLLSNIRSKDYSSRALYQEIENATSGINAVLSLHKYGASKTKVLV